MDKAEMLAGLSSARVFFEKTLSCLGEKDSEFTPNPGAYSVAQHVAHAAQVVEWFLEGVFRPQGLGTNFQEMEREVREVRSLDDALAWWRSAWEEAVEVVKRTDPASWREPIRGEIMAGAPRHSIISGITDHTAHHRGALSVYARARGLAPPMPYE